MQPVYYQDSWMEFYGFPLFGDFAASFLDMGVRVAVSGAETGLICNDKQRTVEFLGEKGIRVPRSSLPESLDAGRASYPLFLKPFDGEVRLEAIRQLSAQPGATIGSSPASP